MNVAVEAGGAPGARAHGRLQLPSEWPASPTAPRSNRPSTVWCSVRRTSSPAAPSTRETVENDDARRALVLFTSGTTGLPKAIPISQGTLSAPTPHDDDRALRPGRTADRRHDVRPDLPRRRLARSARRVCMRATDDRDPAPLRCRRVAPPRGEAPGSRRRSSCRRCSSASSTIPTSATTDLSSLTAIYYGAAAARVELVQTSDGGAAARRRSPTSSVRPRPSVRTPRSRPTITSRPNGSGPSGGRWPGSRFASSTR